MQGVVRSQHRIVVEPGRNDVVVPVMDQPADRHVQTIRCVECKDDVVGIFTVDQLVDALTALVH